MCWATMAHGVMGRFIVLWLPMMLHLSLMMITPFFLCHSWRCPLSMGVFLVSSSFFQWAEAQYLPACIDVCWYLGGCYLSWLLDLCWKSQSQYFSIIYDLYNKIKGTRLVHFKAIYCIDSGMYTNMDSIECQYMNVLGGSHYWYSIHIIWLIFSSNGPAWPCDSAKCYPLHLALLAQRICPYILSLTFYWSYLKWSPHSE